MIFFDIGRENNNDKVVTDFELVPRGVVFQGGAVQLSEDTILVVFQRSRLYRLCEKTVVQNGIDC